MDNVAVGFGWPVVGRVPVRVCDLHKDQIRHGLIFGTSNDRLMVVSGCQQYFMGGQPAGILFQYHHLSGMNIRPQHAVYDSCLLPVDLDSMRAMFLTENTRDHR